jgi:hypothetical protein
MIEGMKIDLIISNSAGTQSHYMLKLLAIESPAEGSAEQSLAGCSVRSLTG